MSAPYRTQDVVRMTGVSYRRLDYWDRLDYIKPSIREADGSGGGKERLYSDEDVRVIRKTKALLDLGFRLSAIMAEGPDALEAAIRSVLNNLQVPA